MERIIEGRAWKLGDNVNTDVLHPPEFFSPEFKRLTAGIREGMARLEAGNPGGSVAGTDLVIVGGKNFGCGSSRESSVRALKAYGVKAILAESFARIFFRSLINLCVPPLVCPGIRDLVKPWDPVRISMPAPGLVLGGEMTAETEGAGLVPIAHLDPHEEKILGLGGLIAYLEEEIRGV